MRVHAVHAASLSRPSIRASRAGTGAPGAGYVMPRSGDFHLITHSALVGAHFSILRAYIRPYSVRHSVQLRVRNLGVLAARAYPSLGRQSLLARFGGLILVLTARRGASQATMASSVSRRRQPPDLRARTIFLSSSTVPVELASYKCFSAKRSLPEVHGRGLLTINPNLRPLRLEKQDCWPGLCFYSARSRG